MVGVDGVDGVDGDRVGLNDKLTSVLRDVQNRRGLENYRIICDESNNTPATVAAGEFIADIYLQPTKSVQFIKLNFIANNSGSFFTEG